MERRVELVGGLGAGILGLIGVVMEAQTLSDSWANPSLSWILGSSAVPGAWNAIQTTQHALLPIALVFVTLMLGAYLHSVHQQIGGLALLVSSSAVAIVVMGFAVFKQPYAAILFVPAPLVVLTAVLAAAVSASALSTSPWPAFLMRRSATLPAGSGHVQPHEGA